MKRHFRFSQSTYSKEVAKARQGRWCRELGLSWQDSRSKERDCWLVGCSCPITSSDAGLGTTKTSQDPPTREGTHSKALNFPNSALKVLGQKELGPLVWHLPSPTLAPARTNPHQTR